MYAKEEEDCEGQIEWWSPGVNHSHIGMKGSQRFGKDQGEKVVVYMRGDEGDGSTFPSNVAQNSDEQGIQ